MKLAGALLALCVLPGSTAFVIPAHQAANVALQATTQDSRDVSRTDSFSPSWLGSREQPPKDLHDPRPQAVTGREVLIQGNSLRTWPVSPMAESVRIMLRTDGRPLDANVELWHGPDYTPSKMKVYIEDGALRPLDAVIATPLSSNMIAAFNTGNAEFPISAAVGPNRDMPDPYAMSIQKLVQGGGAVVTFPLAPEVERVQVFLKSDQRNLKARIELYQGPDNIKQTFQFYASDGYKRPFFAVMATPGIGNVVRIVNENPVEFPFTAYLEPMEDY